MIHEKTFNAISKLKEIEIELHRLKNALELANKALDAKREWVGLTDEDLRQIILAAVGVAEAKLKEKNT